MEVKDFIEEAAIMKDMKHPNLVQLLGEWTVVEQEYMTILCKNCSIGKLRPFTTYVLLN